MVITFTSLNFLFVILHSTYGLLIVVFSFTAYVYYKTRSEGSKIFLYAVGVSGCSGMVFLREYGIDKWFNHMDVSHILMAVGIWVFYLGSKKILEDPLFAPKKLVLEK